MVFKRQRMERGFNNYKTIIMYKLTLNQAIKVHTTNKDFCLFSTNQNNEIVSIKFTNDLRRYRNQYNGFRLTSIIKQSTNLLNIE